MRTLVLEVRTKVMQERKQESSERTKVTVGIKLDQLRPQIRNARGKEHTVGEKRGDDGE